MLSMISFAMSILIFLPFIKSKTTNWFIVQSPPLFVSFFSVFAIKRFMGKKVCLNVSDLWPGSAVELGVLKKGKLYKLLCKMESYIYRKSDLISGQSQEIVDHIEGFTSSPKFVYRNLPRTNSSGTSHDSLNENRKVVYAGLLGFAQGVYKICTEINFHSLGLEFHIYGNGMEKEQIQEFIDQNPERGLHYHGTFEQKEAGQILQKYDAALVPLVVRIHGAVPSKVFELANLGVPILFAGGGEGADIVNKMGLGLTCDPGDVKAIESMLLNFKNLEEAEHISIRKRLDESSKLTFNYEEQFKNFVEFIEMDRETQS